jgi:hypothetical protein
LFTDGSIFSLPLHIPTTPAIFQVPGSSQASIREGFFREFQKMLQYDPDVGPDDDIETLAQANFAAVLETYKEKGDFQKYVQCQWGDKLGRSCSSATVAHQSNG